MARKYRIGLVSLVAALIAALALAGSGECAKRATKTVSKPSAANAGIAGPKKLRVIFGRAFEPIPSSGPSKISVTLCPEETTPATFTASYSKSMPDLEVRAAGDLVGPGKILRANIEVSRVDGEDLIRSASPDTGLVSAQASIGETPTQFWVDISAPKNTTPGVYKGAIAFYSGGKVFDQVPLEVHVLKLRLLGSSRQFGIYTSYGIDGGAGQLDSGSFGQFAKAFQKLGFKFMTLNGTPSAIPGAFNTYSSLGLTGPLHVVCYAFNKAVPDCAELSGLDTARKSTGQTTAFYFCVDNPTSGDDIAVAKKQIAQFNQAAVKCAARVSDEAALEQLQSSLDGVLYNVNMPYVQSMMSGQGKRTEKWEWYWWDARKSVSDNRTYAGIGLWKSGLYGVIPAWMPQEGKDPLNGVNSLRGEALREGVTDTRYITAYMKALRELKDLKRGQDKDYIATTEDYLAKFLANPADQNTPSQLAAFRARMVEFSVKLAGMHGVSPLN